MNNPYKNIGIGILLVEACSLLTGFGKFIYALLFIPGFYPILSAITLTDPYTTFLFYFFMSLDTLINLYGIYIALHLIKKNAYTKQLLYWVYLIATTKILYFVLYIPIKEYLTIDLLIGIFILLFVALTDSKLSRFIHGKHVFIENKK
ncbi:MAG: hypothetical protein RLZZ347_355 [Candidatus Parcubacteria bacterium]|jgi:hypothetical protein